jgi:nucleoside-diphosphate-sugar epimerase
MLQEKGYEVFGLDVGYFAENKLESCLENYPRVSKDVRDVVLEDLGNIDAIIHLAGLSNDPLGEFNPSLTHEINTHASIRLAELAKKAGVKRFIFSSSQSMYGISELDSELDEDNSEKNPVTAYASAKWDAEQVLNSMSCREFIVTSFRPSTVFGASPRLRCDIVFNNLVASAYTTGRIEIMSDGTPWRPIVHIKDVCSAFIAGIEAPAVIVSARAFNVGVPNGNFTVRDIAEAAQNAVPGCELVFTGEHSDPRTYKVCFDRIHNELGDYFKPEWNLEEGGKELMNFFKAINFSEDMFRGRKTVRLMQVSHLIERGFVDNNLRFIGD